MLYWQGLLQVPNRHIGRVDCAQEMLGLQSMMFVLILTFVYPACANEWVMQIIAHKMIVLQSSGVQETDSITVFRSTGNAGLIVLHSSGVQETLGW